MKVTDDMVSRFLAWRLPDDFSPDGGVKFDRPPYPFPAPQWPSGTNLLTATQARAMLEHILGPVREPAPVYYNRSNVIDDA